MCPLQPDNLFIETPDLVLHASVAITCASILLPCIDVAGAHPGLLDDTIAVGTDTAEHVGNLNGQDVAADQTL